MAASLENSYKNLSSFLFALFLGSLPFSNVLVINLGFPLKIQELSLLLLIALLFLGPERKAFISDNRKYLKYFVALSVLVILSFCAGYIDNQKLSPQAASLARISPVIDSLLKAFYVVLSFFAFCVSRHYLSKKNDVFRFYFWGAGITCAISIFFFICGLLDINTASYFHWSSQTITLGQARFVRNGTFLEGNFLGLYLLISYIIATHFRKKLLAYALVIATASTFSTTAILGLFLYFIFCTLRRVPVLPYLLTLMMALFVANSKTNGLFFQEQFIQKLPVFKLVLDDGYNGSDSETYLNSEEVTEKGKPGLHAPELTALSATERASMIKIGGKIFSQNPIFGIGPANYKFHYFEHTKDTTSASTRPFTANNVYLEILCEYGVLFFLTIALFFATVFKNAYRENHLILFLGLPSLLIYFLSYPSFSIFFLWVFLAILSLKKGDLETSCP